MLSSCNTNQIPVVPPNQIQFLKESGHITADTTLAPFSSFKVKMWIYAHYSFNKIEVSKQKLTPTLGAVLTVTSILNGGTSNPFSSNYTTTITSGLVTTPQSDTTEKWIFTVTDNQGKMFSKEIILTTDNSNS